jgi:hypothetical protein
MNLLKSIDFCYPQRRFYITFLYVSKNKMLYLCCTKEKGSYNFWS